MNRRSSAVGISGKVSESEMCCQLVPDSNHLFRPVDRYTLVSQAYLVESVTAAWACVKFVSFPFGTSLGDAAALDALNSMSAVMNG